VDVITELNLVSFLASGVVDQAVLLPSSGKSGRVGRPGELDVSSPVDGLAAALDYSDHLSVVPVPELNLAVASSTGEPLAIGRERDIFDVIFMLKSAGFSFLLTVPGVDLNHLVPSEQEEVTTGRPLGVADLLVGRVLIDLVARLSSSFDVHLQSDGAIAGQIKHIDEILVVSDEEEVAVRAEVDGDALISIVDFLRHRKAGEVEDADFAFPSVSHESAVRREI